MFHAIYEASFRCLYEASLLHLKGERVYNDQLGKSVTF